MRRNIFSIVFLALVMLAAGCGSNATNELKEAGAVVDESGINDRTGGKLRKVSIPAAKFKPELLAKVKGAEPVHVLDLQGCPVTDEMLAHVKDLTNLIALKLAGTKITDAGVAKLVDMPVVKGLTTLSLNGTGITDEGAVHLEKLKHLKVIHLHETKVTAKGYAKLKAALPETMVQDQ